MKLRQLLPVIVVGLLLFAEEGNPTSLRANSIPSRANSIPPRATQIGDQLVLVIPQETSDPGDRRPR
jgi:hypothetical protein